MRWRATSGFFFVKKNDGSLSEITTPNAGRRLHATPEGTDFLKLDLWNTYYLVLTSSRDEWKTAFKTPLGHLGHGAMRFRLTNALAVYQALINDVLRDMLNKFLFVYLDDILSFLETEEEHIQYVHLFLRRLLENHLFVKGEKSKFHLFMVAFVGFIIQPGQLLPDLAKTPSASKQLQQFLGFANFYRRFFRDHRKVAAPLTKLTPQIASSPGWRGQQPPSRS